ncbi:hypothetical protein B0H13DRAFT_2413244 [Mycena leptocephala]|nr:hypothetical protein B0H13DRAFT_2413244 [Mycena leptocephala]
MASSVSTAIKVENVRLKDILTSHADRLRELEVDDPLLEPRPAFTFTEGGSSRIEQEILIHRQFIPVICKSASTASPSLAICTSATRACANMVDVQRKRKGNVLVAINLPAVFTSAIVLLLNEWSGKCTGTVPDPEREMASVCGSWQIAGLLWDILAELASISQLPLPTNGTPDASHMFPGLYQPDDRHPSVHTSGAGTSPMDPSPFAPTPASETWFPPDDPYAEMSTDPARASCELGEMMSLIDSDTISMWTNTPVGIEVDDWGTYFTNFSEITTADERGLALWSICIMAFVHFVTMVSTATLLAQATESLANPNNPTFCCKYYICLLSQIEDLKGNFWENPIIPDASYASDSLRLKLAPLSDSMFLLDVLSVFLTTNRSREDMVALAQRMERCECDRTDRLVDAMHAWKWDFNVYCCDPPDFATRSCTLEGLIGIVAHIFSDALELRRRRRTGWPKNRQCLAGTDEAAATMLCRWLDFSPILPLLRAISEAASRRLPKNLVAILKRGVDSLPVDFAGEATPYGIVYPITLVFDTFHRLLNIDDGVSPAYFYREHCPLLLETLNRVAEIEKKMTWIFDGGWESGLNLGGVVHSQLVLPFDEAKRINLY